MIKNLNDLFTFICLIVIMIISIRIFVISIVTKKNNDSKVNRFSLIKDYIDNEEE